MILNKCLFQHSYGSENHGEMLPLPLKMHSAKRFSHFNKSFTKISIPDLISDIQMYIWFETESPSGKILFSNGSLRLEMGSTYVCPIGKL